MAEEPQQQSIQDRIAALNMGHVGRAPITAQSAKRPFPPVPAKRVQSSSIPTAGTQSQEIGNRPNGHDVLPPPVITRTGQKTNGTSMPSPQPPPRTNTNGSSVKPVPPPRLPPRSESSCVKPSPALPPRRPSEMTRRDSQDSVVSTMSSMSALSGYSGTQSSVDSGRVRAPAYDPATLPPLPPKRSEEDKAKDLSRLPPAKASRTASATSAITNKFKSSQSTPSLPRRTTNDQETPPPPDAPSRRLPPPDLPKLPPRTTTGQDPAIPPRSNGLLTPENTPPPIPISTRPDLSKIMATKPKMPTRPTAASDSCLLCRDFSGPDDHATKFPRHTVRDLDSLAVQLTQPFSSDTDKARAIFVWLHHNIDYNTEAFFSKNIQPSTPASTLQTGLAVCEGYAGLYAALATKAGLQSVVVGGHGKGYGFTAVGPGDPVPPPDPTGHAWNAVQIDNGEWKLIDACWGAGHVTGDSQSYQRYFNPIQFTCSNEDFGKTHFPANQAHFYRADGRALSWEEYVLGDAASAPAGGSGGGGGGGGDVQICSNLAPREGLAQYSFRPKQFLLSNDPRQGPIRFEFGRVCQHWDPIRNGPGPPYAYILAMGIAPDGDKSRNPDYVALNEDGHRWWIDMDPARFGRSGDLVRIWAVTTVKGQDARGLGKKGWERAWGSGAMAFASTATWQVV